MMSYQNIFMQVVNSERYAKNVMYGVPRPGHAEGTVKAHIAELEKNLATVIAFLGGFDPINYTKLRILIHVHDAFKAESKRNAAILDSDSHASLARTFLSQYTDDQDLLNMVQYHDIGYAVYRKYKEKERWDYKRLKDALATIKDLDLFVTFVIIDSCTASKGREMINWFVDYVVTNYNLKYIKKGTVEALPAGTPQQGEW